MFACYWWAVDEDGRSWCIREFTQKGLIVREAAEKILELTLPGEHVAATYAPPDMWSRQKDTGKTMAELFMLNQVGLIKADNNRVQGHMMMKDAMAPRLLRDPYVMDMVRRPDGSVPDKLPGLMFFDVCKGAIGDIQDIQADEKNPNDCAKDPHEVTHTCVTGDTLVRTPCGDVPIESLVGTQGEVYCWDGEKIVVREYEACAMTNPAAEVFEVELEDGTKIKATANHRVLTAAGWKEIRELSFEDEVLQF